MHYPLRKKKTPKYLSHNLICVAYTEKLHRNIRDDLNDMQVVKKIERICVYVKDTYQAT